MLYMSYELENVRKGQKISSLWIKLPQIKLSFQPPPPPPVSDVCPFLKLFPCAGRGRKKKNEKSLRLGVHAIQYNPSHTTSPFFAGYFSHTQTWKAETQKYSHNFVIFPLKAYGGGGGLSLLDISIVFTIFLKVPFYIIRENINEKDKNWIHKNWPLR